METFSDKTVSCNKVISRMVPHHYAPMLITFSLLVLYGVNYTTKSDEWGRAFLRY